MCSCAVECMVPSRRVVCVLYLGAGIVAEKPHYAIVMHYYRCGTVEKFMTSEVRPGKLCFAQLDNVHRIRMCLQVSMGYICLVSLMNPSFGMF